MTKLLLKHGADKNIKNSAGETAHDIAEKNNFPRVIYLLDKQVVQAENPLN
jgi:ankyrin repeat protein